MTHHDTDASARPIPGPLDLLPPEADRPTPGMATVALDAIEALPPATRRQALLAMEALFDLDDVGERDLLTDLVLLDLIQSITPDGLLDDGVVKIDGPVRVAS